MIQNSKHVARLCRHQRTQCFKRDAFHQPTRRICTVQQVLFLAIGAFLLSRRGVLAPVLSIGAEQSDEVQGVEEKIKSSKVFLISKEYCPFCQKAKSILKNLGVTPEVLELADANKQPLVDNPAAIADYMEKITGARTVPRLFIAGKFVGGCDRSLVIETTDSRWQNQ